MTIRRRKLLQFLGLGAAGALTAARARSATVEQSRGPVTLFLSGDVMTGRGIDQILGHPGDPTLYEGYMRSALGYVELAEQDAGPLPRKVAPEYIWGDALALLDEIRPAARIINLETAVTRSDQPWPGKRVHYRMHPANVGCLSAARIDCCALANNHTLDWGRPGLEETLETLASAGLTPAGAGRDRAAAAAPAVLPLPGGGRLLVFGLAEPGSGIPPNWAAGSDRPGINLLEDLSDETANLLAAEVAAVRQRGDVVVASIHWGGNWGYRVPDPHRRFAHRLIEKARVDVVHGHSSHHPMGIEVHQGRPILYGCGDLINDYEGIGGREDYRPGLTAMYLPSLERSGKLKSLSLVPLRIARFRLNRASPDEAAWLGQRLDRESRKLGAGVETRPDGTLALRWRGEARAT